MRRTIKLICLVGLLITFGECDDPLKEVVYSELTKELAFGTKEDAQASVNAVYQPLIDVSHRAIFFLNDIASDAGYRKNDNCEILNFDKLNEAQDVIESWEGYYLIISRANISIEHIGKMSTEKFLLKPEDVTPKAFEDAEKLKNRYVAEAKFLRAWSYYQLTDIFYRVPLVTVFSTEQKRIPLSDIDVIEEQIVKDLTEAAPFLPLKYASNDDAGRATSGAAYGMLCRLYMRAGGRLRQKGDDAQAQEAWNNALIYADKVLEMETNGVYSLQAKVWDIFNPNNDISKYNNELIFAIRSNPNSRFGTSDIGMNFTPWEYDMGWNLINIPLSLAWRMDRTNDERFTQLIVSGYKNVYEPKLKKYVIPETIEKSGTVYQETENPANPAKPYITYELDAVFTKKYKYQRTGTYNYNCGNNMPVLRLADVILCKAEIINELNGPSQESVDLINRIRERAFRTHTFNLKLSDFSSREALRNAICDERMIEFTLEGMRRPDLIRMGLWQERMNQYIATVKLKTEYEERNAETSADLRDPDNAPHDFDYSERWKIYPQDLTGQDKRRYFPIPKKETDLNADLLRNLD